MNTLKNKSAVMNGIAKWAVACALLLVLTSPAVASSGTTTTVAGADAPFTSILNMLVAWSTGALGKTIAVGSFLVGMGIGVVKQSVMAVVIGISMALVLAFGPGIITSIFTATLPGDALLQTAAAALTLPVCPIS